MPLKRRYGSLHEPPPAEEQLPRGTPIRTFKMAYMRRERREPGFDAAWR
jgi:hypothetical protein